MSQAYFIREGERFVPTGLGPSFWDPAKQGGAQICGLTAQLLGAIAVPVPMLPVRLTLDIYGAVPMAPLTARTRLLREGKRIQLAELELDAEGRTWVRATLLRVRRKARKRNWCRSLTLSPKARKARPVCWRNRSALLAAKQNQGPAQYGCGSSPR